MVQERQAAKGGGRTCNDQAQSGEAPGLVSQLGQYPNILWHVAGVLGADRVSGAARGRRLERCETLEIGSPVEAMRARGRPGLDRGSGVGRGRNSLTEIPCQAQFLGRATRSSRAMSSSPTKELSLARSLGQATPSVGREGQSAEKGSKPGGPPRRERRKRERLAGRVRSTRHDNRGEAQGGDSACETRSRDELTRTSRIQPDAG